MSVAKEHSGEPMPSVFLPEQLQAICEARYPTQGWRALLDGWSEYLVLEEYRDPRKTLKLRYRQWLSVPRSLAPADEERVEAREVSDQIPHKKGEQLLTTRIRDR